MAHTVYVVAWEFEDGGGFDWYFTKKAAMKAFEEEKQNCREFAVNGWTAFYFEHQTDLHNNDAITNEIDMSLIEFCDNALETYRVGAPPSNMLDRRAAGV